MADENNELIIDREALDLLREVMEGDYADLIETYLDNVPKQLGRMKEAFENNDATTLSEAAHTVKGTSANLAAPRLSDLGFQIEHGAKSEGCSHRIRALLGQAEAEFAKVAVILKQELDRS